MDRRSSWAWPDATNRSDRRIEEGIPKAALAERERAEITRRLIAGERILNECGTAQGRRFVERRREEERKQRERAAWKHVAQQVRAAVGGPLRQLHELGRWSDKSPTAQGYNQAVDGWKNNPMKGIGL